MREQHENASIVFFHAFPFKAIHAVHVFALVVSSVEVHALREESLQRQESEHALATVRATVDKVAIEEVLCKGKRKGMSNM